MRKLLLLTAVTLAAHAQFTLQHSDTDASFRGVHALSDKMAWVSGTKGTVLRTTDGGKHWQTCATPPNAEQLDFRGIQAFSSNEAVVMSSGKGDLSRLYKTKDGCKTWTLLFRNPDSPQGFFDSMVYDSVFDTLLVLGDPVRGDFRLFSSTDGSAFTPLATSMVKAAEGESAFAASNSLFGLRVVEGNFSFITAGAISELISEAHGFSNDPNIGHFSTFVRHTLPLPTGDSSGAFSIAVSPVNPKIKNLPIVIVGGNYREPDTSEGTAITSTVDELNWHPAQTPRTATAPPSSMTPPANAGSP